MYLIFRADTDPYKSIGDITRLYMWSTIDSWVEDISRDIVEVWFSDLYGYWKTRLSSNFGDICIG